MVKISGSFLNIFISFMTLFIAIGEGQRLAGECAGICNDLRTEVLTLEMCREAKRTLPRPKVGDFCTTAMEQGFSDACVAICMDQPPVGRVAQACRAAAIEMPRPTVRRWCEHGYNQAFYKTIHDLKSYFKAPEPVVSESHVEEQTNSRNTQEASKPQEQRQVLATIPVTLDDKETKELILYKGQDAEEAVVEFCREHVSNEVATCIRELLSVVIEKLEEISQK